MARSGPLLTEAQWKKIAPLLPRPAKHRKGGRPWIENRRVLEGILCILRSGARWQDLPEKYPHPSTCWRRICSGCHGVQRFDGTNKGSAHWIAGRYGFPVVRSYIALRVCSCCAGLRA
jgi:transposase